MDNTNILTPAEVKGRLRCSLRHVYDLFARGELDGFRDGRLVKVFESSIAAYIERHRNRRAAARLDAEAKTPTPQGKRSNGFGAVVHGFRHLKI